MFQAYIIKINMTNENKNGRATFYGILQFKTF